MTIAHRLDHAGLKKDFRAIKYIVYIFYVKIRFAAQHGLLGWRLRANAGN
jgi:hypothetical protein